MGFWSKGAGQKAPPSIEDVYESPGHLIRRSHQISTSLFAEELGTYGLTPIQYASLLTLRDQPGIDQRTLSRTIAIDRSTVGGVLNTLETKGLICREIPEDNKRIKTAKITPAGDQLLSQTIAAISNVQRRLLEPLSPDEQAMFLKLLSRLVKVNNAYSRAPLDIDRRYWPATSAK